MRIADVDFILIPEWLTRPTGSKPDDDHWISRWHRNLATADWLDVRDQAPAAALLAQADAITRPVIIVTHGGGVDVVLEAGSALGAARAVIAAFIVAPSPILSPNQSAPENVERLPFASVMISSDDHPEFHPTKAQLLAERLGSHFVAAGPVGRIDSVSGQGPWPEGLLRLGQLLKQLSAP